jgi:hypothetical protein
MPAVFHVRSVDKADYMRAEKRTVDAEMLKLVGKFLRNRKRLGEMSQSLSAKRPALGRA